MIPTASLAEAQHGAMQHEKHVIKASETKEATMVRVVDMLKADAQLSGCKTIAELCDRKPNVCSVLLGGNCIGAQHPLNHNTVSGSMACIVGASYVAKCCFVATKMLGEKDGEKDSEASVSSEVSSEASSVCSDEEAIYDTQDPVDLGIAADIAPSADKFITCFILLPHHATIADLKRELLGHASGFEFHHRGLVCRDPDGNILRDSAQLPTAIATACADMGCHATFFIDIKPESMGKEYVKQRVQASPLAIETFCQGTFRPCVGGLILL